MYLFARNGTSWSQQAYLKAAVSNNNDLSGYAVGLSRPFVASSGKRCVFCAESFAAGLEIYGGLGTSDRLNLNGTSHYAAPVFGWAAGLKSLEWQPPHVPALAGERYGT